MKKINRLGQYIYSYDYKDDENWLVDKEKYSVEEVEKLALENAADFMARADVKAEINKTVETVNRFYDKNNKVKIFTLLSDSHYVLGGNWECTEATILAVNKRLEEKLGRKIDGIIHLGDFTDGILSKEVASKYSSKVIDGLAQNEVPLYIAVGNHDANYFRNNDEKLDFSAQGQMYLNQVLDMTGSDYCIENENKTNADNEINSSSVSNPVIFSGINYVKKVKNSHITMLVLGSFDVTETNRYGYSLEQIAWAEQQLKAMPEDEKIIILSHDAPLTELDFWAKEIRNGREMTEMLDNWNLSHDNRILGFFHGHTHADFIYDKLSFPIISIGCSKIEYFEDKKPEGAYAPARYEDEVSQELWDTLIVDEATGDIDLVRFGAGYDRRYYIGQGNSKGPLVLAHRGASGYAPENTLEAFALAADLGADGVELDVQFTRDRVIVVIHDEQIDRVSDGSGNVCDYTLEELKEFNFNKTHPEYAYCEIPTLEEVLELLKPTGLKINIELKTGVNFYPGIEAATAEMVEKYDMADRVIYSSFNHESVIRTKNYIEENIWQKKKSDYEKNEVERIQNTCVEGSKSSSKFGLLYSIGIADVASYAKALGVDALHPSVNDTRYPNFIESAKERGLAINVWTVNSKSDLMRMQQLGVDSVITNYPDLAREIYEDIDLEAIRERLVTEAIEKNKADYVKRLSQLQNQAVQGKAINGTMNSSLNGKANSMSDHQGHININSKKKAILHIVGETYRVVRKPFVKLDRFVNRLAGK